MKRYLLFCQLILISITAAQAQFSVGAEGLTIQSGTDFFADSLTLNPSTALTLTNQTLTLSAIAAPGTPPSVSRVYVFSSPVTFSGTAGLYYKDSELNGNNESLLQIAYGNPGYTVTTASTSDALVNYVSSLLSSAELDRITAATPGALPVSLTHFTVENAENGVLLNWETTFETNSDFFEVQRSTDAQIWEKLQVIEAAHDSKSLQKYHFTDVSPKDGINYYRLRMADLDGTYTYSRMRTILMEGMVAVKAYPNPTVKNLEVRLSDWQQVQKIQLIDLQGKEWYATDQAGMLNQIDTRSLVPGMYLVQVTYLNSSQKTVKVIKQ